MNEKENPNINGTDIKANDVSCESSVSANNIAENTEDGNLDFNERKSILELEKNREIAILTLDNLLEQIKANKTIHLGLISNKRFSSMNGLNPTKFCNWLWEERQVDRVRQSVYKARKSSVDNGYYVNCDDLVLNTYNYNVEHNVRGYLTPIGQEHYYNTIKNNQELLAELKVQEKTKKTLKEQQDDRK